MKAERDEFEERSSYGGERKEQLEVVKTLVAMTNTNGGTVLCNRAKSNVEGGTRAD